jgi:iron-sulfur cluster protein
VITTPNNLKEYKAQLRLALKNQFLSTTLDSFAAAYGTARANAFSTMDIEGMINEIAVRKDAAIPYLEELFAMFKVRAEAAGARVHTARTALEANRIIARIAKENGAKQIVKSKSMTAEEIFLNDHLEGEGLVVTETDLGEWIIQLRHEGPSHMVMPAIHLTRRQVGELFTSVTGRQVDPNDIEAMVKVARRELRQAFLHADMGISGANFAVAATGTIGIVSNEGNARLVTTLPRVHVALVGFDKLVPDLNTALRILRVLPRNATGQAISTYVTWITGATECSTGPNGRKELHIVFLDNGRLAVAKDPIFSQVLRCIRCGACANVCPIYRMVGGHNYGHVYIGAIGLILTFFYHGRENARAIVQNCLNCQACKAVCPAAIDLPYLIKEVHRSILLMEDEAPAKNRLLRRVLTDRRLFHFLLRSACKAQQPLLGEQGFIRHLPLFLSQEHNFRSLPAIAKTPLRDTWEAIRLPRLAQPKYRVALFAGCLIDFVYPEEAKALVELLRGRGVQLEYPMQQGCCGLPAMMMGEKETAAEVAVQNVRALDPAAFDFVLTLCASCGSHIRENYPKLLADKPGVGVMVKGLTDRVIDFSSFMVNVLGVDSRMFRGSGRKVAYHAPCHLCRGLKVTEQPRILLKTAGLEYLAAKDEEVCCGFGGSFSIDFPMLSGELLKRKLDNVEATGAELLVTDCPGCVLQLRGGMEKRGQKIPVKHIAEVVAEEQIKNGSTAATA